MLRLLAKTPKALLGILCNLLAFYSGTATLQSVSLGFNESFY